MKALKAFPEKKDGQAESQGKHGHGCLVNRISRRCLRGLAAMWREQVHLAASNDSLPTALPTRESEQSAVPGFCPLDHFLSTQN
jgi:hypothetical protein